MRLPSWWPIVALPAVAAVVAALVLTNPRPGPAPIVLAKAPAEHVYKQTGEWFDGVAVAHVTDLTKWDQTTGEHPAVVVIYTNLAAPFPGKQVREIMATGALPLLQINPTNDLLTSITAGQYNRELAADQAAIRTLGQPIAVSFGHEMNGTWSSWGCHKSTAGQYVAAYRYVHNHLPAGNIIWVWNPNKTGGVVCAPAPWFPGRAYVDWIGIDGYLRQLGQNFDAKFGPMIAAARELAPGDPVFIAETGVPAGPADITMMQRLFRGAHASGLTGLVWFDEDNEKAHYQPFDNPEFLAAFRAEVGATGGAASG